MGKYKFYASDYASPDSNVITGGGTDSTHALQKLLDTALSEGHVHLVLDGAFLTTGLVVHSNTYIECPDSSCGLYLADNSDTWVICNSNKDCETIKTFNITISGGTYNQNCFHQIHHHEDKIHEGLASTFVTSPNMFQIHPMVEAFEFVGIKDLTMRDVTIRNQRTFAMHCVNFERVFIENIKIDLIDYMKGTNQDGLHFVGPGRFLTIKNLTGNCGDDIIALTPDEYDMKSGITDVIIDGLMMNNADQGIRMLSRGKGRLDRITVKNITGRMTSFGFFINPWYKEGSGNFGTIYFENINLEYTKPMYDYFPPFLFWVGGHVENLVLKNIFFNLKGHNVKFLELGLDNNTLVPYEKSGVKNIYIDGLFINDAGNIEDQTSPILVYSEIQKLTIRNVFSNSEKPLISYMPGGKINKLIIE